MLPVQNLIYDPPRQRLLDPDSKYFLLLPIGTYNLTTINLYYPFFNMFGKISIEDYQEILNSPNINLEKFYTQIIEKIVEDVHENKSLEFYMENMPNRYVYYIYTPTPQIYQMLKFYTKYELFNRYEDYKRLILIKEDNFDTSEIKLIRYILVGDLYNQFKDSYDMVIIPREVDLGYLGSQVAMSQTMSLNNKRFSEINKFELVIKVRDIKTVLSFIQDTILDMLNWEYYIEYTVVYLEADYTSETSLKMGRKTTKFQDYEKYSEDWLKERLVKGLNYTMKFDIREFERNKEKFENFIYPDTSRFLNNLSLYMFYINRFDAEFLLKEFPHRKRDFYLYLQKQRRFEDKLISVPAWLRFLGLHVNKENYHIIQVYMKPTDPLPKIDYMLIYQLFLTKKIVLLDEQKHFPFLVDESYVVKRLWRRIMIEEKNLELENLHNEYKFYIDYFDFFRKASNLSVGGFALNVDLISGNHFINIENLIRTIATIETNFKLALNGRFSNFWNQYLLNVPNSWKHFYYRMETIMNDVDKWEAFESVVKVELKKTINFCLNLIKTNTGNWRIANDNQFFKFDNYYNIQSYIYIFGPRSQNYTAMIDGSKKIINSEFVNPIIKDNFVSLVYQIEQYNEIETYETNKTLRIVGKRINVDHYIRKVKKLKEDIDLTTNDDLTTFKWSMVNRFLEVAISTFTYSKNLFITNFIEPLKEYCYTRDITDKIHIFDVFKEPLRIIIEREGSNKKILDWIDIMEKKEYIIQEFLDRQYAVVLDNTNQVSIVYQRVYVDEYIEAFFEDYHHNVPLLLGLMEESKLLIRDPDLKDLLDISTFKEITGKDRDMFTLEKLIFELQFNVIDERLEDGENKLAKKLLKDLLIYRNIIYKKDRDDVKTEHLQAYNNLFDERNSLFERLIKRLNKVKTNKLGDFTTLTELKQNHNTMKMQIRKKILIKKNQWDVMAEMFKYFKAEIMKGFQVTNPEHKPESLKFITNHPDSDFVEIIYVILFYIYLINKGGHRSIGRIDFTLNMDKLPPMWIEDDEKIKIFKIMSKYQGNVNILKIFEAQQEDETAKLKILFENIQINFSGKE